METEPRIRGTLLRPSIDWLGSLVVARRTTPQALGVRFEAEDMHLFTSGPGANEWIPIATSARIDAALLRAHGGDVEDVMREVGARWPNRVATPKHAQPGTLLGRTAMPDPCTLVAEIRPFDFGRWRTLERTPGGFALALDDADALPDTTRFQLEGFLRAGIARHVGLDVSVMSERPTACQTVFRGRLCAARRRADPRTLPERTVLARRLTG